MKKRLLCVVLATMLAVTAAGCGSSAETAEEAAETTEAEEEETEPVYDSQTQRDLEGQLEKYIKDNTPINLRAILASDWLSVYVSDVGVVEVYVRPIFYYAVPFVADEVLPVAREAVEDAGLEKGHFVVNYYEETNDGKIDGTTTMFSSLNWETGMYSSDQDDIRSTNIDLDSLLDYYSEYADLIQELRDGYLK